MTWASVVLVSVIIVVVNAIAWRFLNWVWIRPKRMEKILRKQGLKGNPYKILFGDAKETAVMYEESYAKPIAIHDDIGPRVMPFISKTIQTYGEKSFMWVGPRPMVFIMDVDTMKIVMKKHTTFQKSFKISTPILRRLIGGIIRFEGEKWSQNRKKLNPLFHMDKLKKTVAVMQRECERVLDIWSNFIPKDGSSSHGVVDAYDYLPDYTGSVVSQTLFGISYTNTVKRTFQIISELLLLSNQAQPFTIPGEQYLPTKKYKRAETIETELKGTFTDMMNERLRKRSIGEINNPPDLFDVLLSELDGVDANDNKAHADVMHEIIQQCKLFFVAGNETTSNLIAWTIIMLGVHQEWQARARDEVSRVLADKGKIDSDDLSQMKILNMIIHEVLRLFPPSVEVTRVVEEDTDLGELRLPKGVMVMLPVMFLHRSTRIWGEDASEFKPERFSEGVLKAANGRAAFLPFGWGVRSCIGSNLALWEAKVFVALLLQKFEFEVSPDYEHGPLVSLNMLPQYGAPIVLRKL